MEPIDSNIQQAIYKIAAQDGGMDALQRFYAANSPMDPNEKKISPLERQCQRSCMQLANEYDFIRVNGIGAEGKTYYKAKPAMLYRPLEEIDRNAIVIKAFSEVYGRKPMKNKIEAIGDTLESWVDKSVDGLDNNLMEITDDLYWDTENATLTESISDPCFRVLFDKRPTDTLYVNRSDISADNIKLYFRETLSLLEENDGVIIPHELSKSSPMFSHDALPLSPFWTWANQDPDTFNDLLKAVASNFMLNKPKGAFILIGKTRNGKSSFIKMLHTLFGGLNTSSARLTDLKDGHINYTLLSSMLNAPDEEDEGNSKEVLRNQSNFKSIASHESLPLPVFYSQNPQWIKTDFMSFYPMNDTPDWQGNGAEACMRRSLVLMFRNDLSKFDNNGRNFEKETYTADFYSRLLGVVLAIAKYYHGRKMEFSETMAKDKQAVSQEVNNYSIYLDTFFKYFDSYTSTSLIWEDYKLWCEERDLKWIRSRAFGGKISLRGPTPTNLVLDGEATHCYKICPGKPKSTFYDNRVVERLGGETVRYYLTSEEGNQVKKPRKARSVIGLLEMTNGEL